ncbi:MAG: hypothetical protein M3P33_03075, partial [bacterium]|nr:hypothetical protein [bacterium]
KYMLDYTYNPIYPLFQNFRTNIKGDWQFKQVLEPADLQGQFIFRIILAITLLLIALTIWKKPKGWQFHLLGLGSWLFLGLTFGVSAYIKSWADYVWVVRFMLLPYTYLLVAISVILFYYIPLRLSGFIRHFYSAFAFCIVFLIVASSQLAWAEINKYYLPTNKTWATVKYLAAEMITDYKGGGILLPEGSPDITYALVQYHNVKGKDMVGQMFDPYFYFDEKGLDPYAHWNEVNPESENGYTFRDEVLGWIKKNNIQYIITFINRDRYMKLFELESNIFQQIKIVPNSIFVVYKVNIERI